MIQLSTLWESQATSPPSSRRWRRAALPQTQDPLMIWMGRRRRRDPSSTSERKKRRQLADLGKFNPWELLCSISRLENLKWTRKCPVPSKVLKGITNSVHNLGCWYRVATREIQTIFRILYNLYTILQLIFLLCLSSILIVQFCTVIVRFFYYKFYNFLQYLYFMSDIYKHYNILPNNNLFP